MHRLAIGLLAVMVLAFTPFASARGNSAAAHRGPAARSQLYPAGRRGAVSGRHPVPWLWRQEKPAGPLGRRRARRRLGGARGRQLRATADHPLQAYATVCTGMQLWGRERAGDLYAMMEWVRQQSWADQTASSPPGGAMAAGPCSMPWRCSPATEAESATRLTGLPEEPLDGPRGAFIIYPFTGLGALAPSRGLRVDVPIKAHRRHGRRRRRRQASTRR